MDAYVRLTSTPHVYIYIYMYYGFPTSDVSRRPTITDPGTDADPPGQCMPMVLVEATQQSKLIQDVQHQDRREGRRVLRFSWIRAMLRLKLRSDRNSDAGTWNFPTKFGICQLENGPPLLPAQLTANKILPMTLSLNPDTSGLPGHFITPRWFPEGCIVTSATLPPISSADLFPPTCQTDKYYLRRGDESQG